MSQTRRQKLENRLRSKAENLAKQNGEKDKAIKKFKRQIQGIKHRVCDDCRKEFQQVMES